MAQTKRKFEFKGQDAAKKDVTRAQHMAKKVEVLDQMAKTEKSELKAIDDLKSQVQAQNMMAVLNHPSVSGNPALSDKITSRIMTVMGHERWSSSQLSTCGERDGDRDREQQREH